MPIITIPKSERGLVVQALADPNFLQSFEANPAADDGLVTDTRNLVDALRRAGGNPIYTE